MVIRQQQLGYSLKKNKKKKEKVKGQQKDRAVKKVLSHTGALGRGSLLTPPKTNPKKLIFGLRSPKLSSEGLIKASFHTTSVLNKCSAAGFRGRCQ